jgi:hypothetical protein
MTARTVIAPMTAAIVALSGSGKLHADPAQHATSTRETRETRVIGHGQIRYAGAGPEKWAYRFRRERRVVYALRARLAGRLDQLVGLVLAFECIHGREGSWGANTGNGYYGGLQFGAHEWRLYGGRYTSSANLATPAQQIAAGITYHAVSGFYPWPNTARACGLLP